MVAAYHEEIVDCLLKLEGMNRSMDIRIGQLSKANENTKLGELAGFAVIEVLKNYRDDVIAVKETLKKMKIEEIVDNSKFRKVTVTE